MNIQPKVGHHTWILANPVFEENRIVEFADSANCDCGQCGCGGEWEGLDLAISLGQHLIASAAASAVGYGKDDDDDD